MSLLFICTLLHPLDFLAFLQVLIKCLARLQKYRKKTAEYHEIPKTTRICVFLPRQATKIPKKKQNTTESRKLDEKNASSIRVFFAAPGYENTPHRNTTKFRKPSLQYVFFAAPGYKNTENNRTLRNSENHHFNMCLSCHDGTPRNSENHLFNMCLFCRARLRKYTKAEHHEIPKTTSSIFVFFAAPGYENTPHRSTTEF